MNAYPRTDVKYRTTIFRPYKKRDNQKDRGQNNQRCGRGYNIKQTLETYHHERIPVWAVTLYLRNILEANPPGISLG